jgi:predicted permease
MLYEIYQRPWLLILIIATFLLWELIWKAVALWTSAKKHQKLWFVLILIFNTVGILPIIYLIFGRKKELAN